MLRGPIAERPLSALRYVVLEVGSLDLEGSALHIVEAKLAGLQEMMDLSAEEPPVDDRDGH